MKEIGIDTSGQYSKTPREFQDTIFNFAVTVCDKAKASCPACSTADALFFGLDGIWYVSPAAEYIMLVIVLGMLSKEFKFLRNGKAKTNNSGPRYSHFRIYGLKN